jgi:hypothetical protein
MVACRGKLADELNQRVNGIMSSDPTSSSAYKTERYVFIWKTTIKKNWESLVRKKYHLEIDREPFIAPSNIKKNKFTVVNFHAITKKQTT